MKSCPACGCPNLTNYKVVSNHLLKKCSKCSLLITITNKHKWSVYTKKKYSEQYTEDYLSTLPRMRKRYNRQMALIEKYFKKGTLLDVGCGTGHFLQFITEHYQNIRAYGIEPNLILRKAAERNCIAEIKAGKLNKIPYPENYFDVVTCFDVLEHSMDTQDNIKEMHRVLKPNGILLIQAPNYNSLMTMITKNNWDWWCIPDHVIHFSNDALTRFIEKSNFVIKNNFTYEDLEDFLKNIRGLSNNKLYKFMFYIMTPILVLIEYIGSNLKLGAISVILAQKN